MSNPHPRNEDSRARALRWGFVGTGQIAQRMAGVVRTTPAAELVAVTSRRLDTARAFAAEHGAAQAFDELAAMLACADVDAVYVATPTSERERIGIAAARAGKHVLAEKPFADLPSLRRIVAACREHDVCFMDATHFVHHPRHAAIRDGTQAMLGRPLALTTNFLISLPDRGNIRYDPAREPLGALGDLGWYNLRATLEYLSLEAAIVRVEARLRRDGATGAIVGGAGRLVLDDDTVSAWRCGFDANVVDIGLTLSGSEGAVQMDNFIGDDDGPASYRLSSGDAGETTVRVPSALPGAALMFEDFARAAALPAQRERWALASERTQELVDIVYAAARHDASQDAG